MFFNPYGFGYGMGYGYGSPFLYGGLPFPIPQQSLVGYGFPAYGSDPYNLPYFGFMQYPPTPFEYRDPSRFHASEGERFRNKVFHWIV